MGCVAALGGYMVDVTAQRDYVQECRVCSTAPESHAVTSGRTMRTAPLSHLLLCNGWSTAAHRMDDIASRLG